jgi:hypothetical protein
MSWWIGLLTITERTAMKLNLVSLCGNTWEGAEMAHRAKAAYIEQQIALGHMLRLPDNRVVITVEGCNAYQAEADAQWNAKATASNSARLVNSLVEFKRK